jgi:hypothetical protein
MVRCRFGVKCQMFVHLWQNQYVWVVDLVSARSGDNISRFRIKWNWDDLYNYDLYDL